MQASLGIKDLLKQVHTETHSSKVTEPNFKLIKCKRNNRHGKQEMQIAAAKMY